MLLRLTELDQKKIKVDEKVCSHISRVYELIGQKLMPPAAGPLQSRSEHMTVCSFIIYLRSISFS